jgi:hypothetical protein
LNIPRCRIFIVGLLLGLLWPSILHPQTSLVSAALEGAVSDSSGARIPGARVNLREVSTHQTRETSTAADGTFHIGELSPGTYEVSASQTGFGPYRHVGVNLALGSTVRLDIALQSESVTTQMTVTAQPPAIDPTQTSISSAVDKERIEELPVESRNYLNFALLAPGVAASAAQPGKQPLGALPDSGFTFGGLRGRSNNVTIDGLDNNDEYVGSSRTELSLETVQEFQVVNAGLSAETGGASGGSINVITRVGANTVHGDAFVFAENGLLNARNPIETESASPMLHKYRTGVALGGPIVKDRTFYYAAFEQEHNRALEDSDLNPTLVSAINRIVGAHTVTDNFFPTSRAETEACAKVNHQLTPRNSVMLRWAFTNNREAGDAFNNLGWTDPSARGSSFTRDQAVVGALTTVFDPRSVGDFRFQFADRRAVVRTNDPSEPGVDIAGLIEFGRPWEGNGARTERHEQATYTYSRAEGHHLLKAGATYNRVSLDAAMADGFGGLYIYPSLADFAAGRFNEFLRITGNPATNFAVANYGAFVQDHWTATRRLTVDLGVRYDFEHLPAGLSQDTNNFSPRVGLAYQAAPSWVVRAGYGIFFDRYLLAALNRVLMRTTPQYTADPHMATPYSQQASVAVEHLIARDLTATVSYLNVRGVKLARTRLWTLEDSASSTYHGASFTLNRRMNGELEFSASYTLSKAYDDASDYTEQAQNPASPAAERARSLQHQQHRFVFNALWELPIGDDEPGKPPKDDWVTKIFGHIEVAPIFSASSGRPVNPLTGVDTYGLMVWPLSARPAGFGRNSLATPGIVNVDFRLLKYFPMGRTAKLDLVSEVFNLLNQANVTRINPVFGSGAAPLPSFLQPLAGAGARQIQFSLDFEF